MVHASFIIFVEMQTLISTIEGLLITV